MTQNSGTTESLPLHLEGRAGVGHETEDWRLRGTLTLTLFVHCTPMPELAHIKWLNFYKFARQL